MIILITFILLVTVNLSFGWGEVTHLYLADTLVDNLCLLGVGIGSFLARYRREFLLGNILADIIVARKFSRRRRRSHSWEAGWRLLNKCNIHNSPHHRAFAYGYLTHLAADTVAHNYFIPSKLVNTNVSISFGHFYWEHRADCYIEPDTRNNLRCLIKSWKDKDNYKDLIKCIFPQMITFTFNKYLFTQMNRITVSSKFTRMMEIYEDLSLQYLSRSELDKYRERSLDRMSDILINQEKSAVFWEDPNGIDTFHTVKKLRKLYNG